jgi:hypothetical protein
MARDTTKYQKDSGLFNKGLAMEAQFEYCKKEGFPVFAPASGNCWNCGRNIYGKGGISVFRASRKLITGCPYCRISYCD